MQFTFLASAVLCAVLANAKTTQVLVGGNTLTFTPTNVTAVTGDVISFQFQSKNHSVTQSTFANPCTPLTNGIDSGFKPVASGATLPVYNYTVTNDSVPFWFYCAQTSPLVHCQQGMVFAINANGNKTITQFQANAKALASSNASSTTSSGASSTATSPASASATKNSAMSPRVGAAGGALTIAAFLVTFSL